MSSVCIFFSGQHEKKNIYQPVAFSLEDGKAVKMGLDPSLYV
jgi:hypothetical protein